MEVPLQKSPRNISFNHRPSIDGKKNMVACKAQTLKTVTPDANRDKVAHLVGACNKGVNLHFIEPGRKIQ